MIVLDSKIRFNLLVYYVSSYIYYVSERGICKFDMMLVQSPWYTALAVVSRAASSCVHACYVL